jgi:hypothetical protein
VLDISSSDGAFATIAHNGEMTHPERAVMTQNQSAPSVPNLARENAAPADPAFVAKLQQAANLANENCDRATALALAATVGVAGACTCGLAAMPDVARAPLRLFLTDRKAAPVFAIGPLRVVG